MTISPVSAAPIAAPRYTLPQLAAPGAATLPTAALNTATLPLRRGGGGGLDLKQVLLFAAAGAMAGFLLPVIPGGPIGGALIGAALSFVL